ncbi:MAG: AraC family transcriptional regulator [Saprospiraceae bacterium]|jgi:AraC-like DNA-binding protein|nr:helix-turn-helix domain-containing protein [Saprospiraceae bacterium]
MNVFRENTPLKENDICVVLDSSNNGFDYPIHNHPEVEINLVMGMSGKRIVGDSTEIYQENDLVILGPYLYHKWYGDDVLLNKKKPYRVITIQFDSKQFSTNMMMKDSFYGIRNLLKESMRGIQFTGKTFESARRIMIEMTENKGFENTISFLKLLDVLSKGQDRRYLTLLEFESPGPKANNHRIQIAYAYILQHYSDPNFKMSDVAEQVQMTENAFSRFFQKQSFRSFSDFLIDLRLGKACKLILETDKTISEIGYMAGFNNLANFNRLFKKYRKYTPNEFRKKYLQDGDFAWDQQVTPWQFVPSDVGNNEIIKPMIYSTRILHL